MRNSEKNWFELFQFVKFDHEMTKNGNETVVEVSCKICGVRTVSGADNTPSYTDDLIKMIVRQPVDRFQDVSVSFTSVSFFRSQTFPEMKISSF